MRLCTTHPVVQRTWTVQLRPERGGPVLHCPLCPSERPAEGVAAPGVLAHLAQHARRDTLPTHLRTCQCHARGCRWHRRHRGCSGPVLLVLAREDGGRLWRLADVCAACAGATAHAAVVPDTALASLGGDLSPLSRSRARNKRSVHNPSEQLRVREMLSYLGVALPADVSASARLLALQCALRSTSRGHVRVPAGLVRGMRLGPAARPPQELEDAGWLLTFAGPPPTGRKGFSAQLLDATVYSQAPGRQARAYAADWALRVCSAPQLSALGTAPTLLGLALTAYAEGENAQTCVEADVLVRMCALGSAGPGQALDLLLGAGFLSSWVCDPHSGDLEWTS